MKEIIMRFEYQIYKRRLFDFNNSILVIRYNVLYIPNDCEGMDDFFEKMETEHYE